MFSELSDTYVDMAVLAEYIAAKEQHGPKYRDEAEAREVLSEEVSEALEEAEFMSWSMEHDDFDLAGIEEHARNCMKESAQVLAVIKKWKST